MIPRCKKVTVRCAHCDAVSAKTNAKGRGGALAEATYEKDVLWFYCLHLTPALTTAYMHECLEGRREEAQAKLRDYLGLDRPDGWVALPVERLSVVWVREQDIRGVTGRRVQPIGDKPNPAHPGQTPLLASQLYDAQPGTRVLAKGGLIPAGAMFKFRCYGCKRSVPPISPESLHRQLDAAFEPHIVL